MSQCPSALAERRPTLSPRETRSLMISAELRLSAPMREWLLEQRVSRPRSRRKPVAAMKQSQPNGSAGRCCHYEASIRPPHSPHIRTASRLSARSRISRAARAVLNDLRVVPWRGSHAGVVHGQRRHADEYLVTIAAMRNLVSHTCLPSQPLWRPSVLPRLSAPTTSEPELCRYQVAA